MKHSSPDQSARHNSHPPSRGSGRRLTEIEKKLGIPTGPSEAILLLEHNGVQGLNELSWPTRLLDEKGCRKSTLHLLARIT